MSGEFLIGAPLFRERREAGEALAAELDDERGPELVVVGLARGGTMIAALRWAGAAGAARVVAAVPVGAAASLALIRAEADDVVCLHALEPFFAVGVWYESFTQVDDGGVVRLVAGNRRGHDRRAAGPG